MVDYLWSGFQTILTGFLIILTSLYVRDNRRSIIFTKLDYFFNLYKEKNESVFLYTSKSAEFESRGKTELAEHLSSISEKEYNLNKEILSLYFDAVDEFDKEFKLKGKFSNAVKKTYESSDEDREKLYNLLMKAVQG